MMDGELRDILRTVAVEGTESYTHLTAYGPSAKWTVGPDNNRLFWVEYCNMVSRRLPSDDSNDVNFCLLERSKDVMPLVGSFVFRFDLHEEEDSWEPYDDDLLYWLVHAYQTVLLDHFKISTENEAELIAVVLESSSHWIESDKKSGEEVMAIETRVHFPYACIDRKVQSSFIRQKVIQYLRKNNVMGLMNRQPLNDWEEILSLGHGDGMAMYGSSEVRGRPKLEMTHIWHEIPIEGDGEPVDLQLEDVFVPKNHVHVSQKTVDPSLFEKKGRKHWLPVFLSSGYWPAILMKKESAKPDKASASAKSKYVFGTGKKVVDQSDGEIADKFLTMMDDSRLVKYALWTDVGKALYTAHNGEENGLRCWITNTEKALKVHPCPDFLNPTVSEACANYYYSFADNPLTLKTLAWYAKEDSPDCYSNWHQEWCLQSMEKALTTLHTDVATALYRVYWLDFAHCPTSLKGKWYQFKSNRWVENHDGVELRKTISNNFMKRFEIVRANLSQLVVESSDDSFKNNANTTIKRISTLIDRLKTVPFKRSIMTEAAEQFSNYRLLSLLDSNYCLTGLLNGVLEVSKNDVIFRSAKPEDYISMSSNVQFDAAMTWKTPKVAECMRWLGQVFTDEKLLHHFLKFASSCLKGKNSDKIFPIFSGDGDNSKSMIVKLFEASLGSYCIKFPVSLLNDRGSNSSGPTPQLARAKATRVAFMDEPEDDIALQKGTIKRYTGGDSFFARMLQDNGGEVQATFKMVLMCNKVPVIPNADKAIKNRTRIFPFMSNWVDSPPESEKEQYEKRKFKKDPTFEQKIRGYSSAFMWIMSQYYAYYSSEGLEDPTIVTETTEAYWRDNDVYAQFVADNIQISLKEDGSKDTSARVSLGELYAEFKNWFRDAFPGTKIPERAIVKAELTSRWGRMNGNSWNGIRLMTGDDS